MCCKLQIMWNKKASALSSLDRDITPFVYPKNENNHFKPTSMKKLGKFQPPETILKIPHQNRTLPETNHGPLKKLGTFLLGKAHFLGSKLVLGSVFWYPNYLAPNPQRNPPTPPPPNLSFLDLSHKGEELMLFQLTLPCTEGTGHFGMLHNNMWRME